MSAKQVVEMFARRWPIEQLFSVAKGQMGLDSAEVRKERSVRRHAALCMAMVTWVEVWVYRRCPELRERSFCRKLAALRSESIQETIFASGPRTKGSHEIASGLAALYATATSAA
ncbi:MAG: transposase [Planctomycetota bacterium]|nr:transposase [Planctomycetota bacterium]